MMITANLRELDTQEEWAETDSTIRLKSAFPLHRGVGTQSSAVVYFELEPGNAIGSHTDSAEEVILILEGKVEITIGGERGDISGPGLALVPPLVAHNVRNVGSELARGMGFFAAARVTSTFEEALLPSGLRVFDTDEI